MVWMDGLDGWSGWSKAMFELTDSMEWTRLEQTMQIGHRFSLAIPVPNVIVNKKN